MQVLLSAVLAVSLLAPPVDHPVEYTATDPNGAVLVYSPDVGTWVGRDACPYGCYNEADKPVQLLVGEVDLATLAQLQVTVRRDGVPVVSFWTFFGDRPVYSIP